LKKSLISNVAQAALGQGLEKAIAFVVIAVLARAVEHSLLGEFFFAIGVLTLVAMLTEFGTSRYLVRAVAAAPDRAALELGQVLRIRLALVSAALVVVNTWVALAEPGLLRVFVPVSLYVLGTDLYYALGATLLGLQRVGRRVVTGLIGPAVLLLMVPIGVALGWGFTALLVIHALSALVMLAISWRVTGAVAGSPVLSGGIAELRGVLAQAGPLFVVALAVLLHSKLDELMLAALRGYEEVATYGAGYKLLEVSRMAVRPAFMVLLPVFAALAVTGDWIVYRRNTFRLLWGAFGVGVFVALGVVPFAGWIVPIVFGASWTEAVPITRILFLSAPALFAGQAAVLIATALYLVRQVIVLAGVAVLLNGMANLWAIPQWGPAGAAWATLCTEGLFAVAVGGLVLAKLRTQIDAAAVGER